MAGTLEGGKKAAVTNKAKYGPNFYKRIGHDGGIISRGGGFKPGSDLAMEAGRKGGKASRKTSKKVEAAFASRELAAGEVVK